jgi:hypothetical protein
VTDEVSPRAAILALKGAHALIAERRVVSRDWEAQLHAWAKPPGVVEQTKMETAEREIRKAISSYPALAARNITVFPQGSYRNRTNIPTESDVDVCVVLKDVIFSDWYFTESEGVKDSERVAAFEREAGLSEASYQYAEFKNDVGAALVAHFGSAAVKRGDKAFDVHESSKWVDSDVLPAFEHRRWHRDYYRKLTYTPGTEFVSDSGKRIINWPQQHYDIGVRKNTVTGERFKAMVRALKNLANAMADAGVEAAKPIPSFLIECLVYNVPNGNLNNYTYTQDMKNVIAVGWEATKSQEASDQAKWVEINELKWLFHFAQPWTRQQAADFLWAAWNYDELGKA